VKTQLGEDFRRFTVPKQVRLLSFVALLQKLYGYDAIKFDLQVKYKDEEGDLLTVSSDEELAEALRHAESQGVLRLYLGLVSAAAKTRTIYFQGVPITALAAGAAPAVKMAADVRFDAVKESSANKATEAVEIKIELEPGSRNVTGVVIERTKVESASVSLPIAPSPSSVSLLSASTALVVKEFSDAVIKSVDLMQARALEASTAGSNAGLAATTESSDAVLRKVDESHERSRMIAVPADFVSAVTDLAAQTVALTNSYSKMTQQLLDPLSKQTIEAANEATRGMAEKLNEDVAAIVKMLMNTQV